MSSKPTAKSILSDWIALLRSGRVEQGEGWLYSHGAYCCVGALGLSLGIEPEDMLHEGFLRLDGDSPGLVLSTTQQEVLSEINDVYCWTFDEIAKMLEGDPAQVAKYKEIMGCEPDFEPTPGDVPLLLSAFNNRRARP